VTLIAGRSFAGRYNVEVQELTEELRELRSLAPRSPVTLVYLSRDKLLNETVVLRKVSAYGQHADPSFPKTLINLRTILLF
jgi:hypothetical protein